MNFFLLGLIASITVGLTTAESEPKKVPNCNCPKIYAPVCSITGKTYGNNCLLRCAGEGAGEACKGPCPCPQTCICLNIYEPICGSDGETYINSCNFVCAKRSNPTLKQLCTGECPCQS
ncbi:hypothetical protein CHUAL_002151 [Chamberlinius hualienensis]